MYELDLDGFKVWSCVGVKKKWKKGNFMIRGFNWVYFLDGYDKFMGY